jgi:4-amino-4-deoxy-L-arabinose transferase-like glycosyltransferase
VRGLVRSAPRFFLLTLAAAIALRLVFLLLSPQVTDDSRVYADIAKNWLQHGVYATSEAGRIVPTDIRLPGYPAFLAFIFTLFGNDNFTAVLVIQLLFDLVTCWLIADLARRTICRRAAKAAFVLTALCPFLANYAAAALSETLEIFFTALALDLAVIGLEAPKGGRVAPWVRCGLAVAAAILLRPDGGVLLVAIGIYLLFVLVRQWRASSGVRDVIVAGALLTAFSLFPLLPWTLRNLHTLRVFQPLAPRYANNPGDYVPMGFNRWVKTWMVDYASVEEIYWQVPGETIDPAKLPARAFDSEEQRQRTVELLNTYNQRTEIDPTLDQQLAGLAQERIRAAPLRYYVELPMARIADMWLRPRTELTPADPRWWEFNDDPKWSVASISLGLLNVTYLGLAIWGAVRGRPIAYLGLVIVFVVLRSALLGSLENPETRYTLECYPTVIWLAAAVFRRSWQPATETRSETS